MPPPDRWECYSPLGKPIPGTPFVALKVPLKEELMRNIFEKDKFSPTILIETLKQQGHNLVGIIDLTFTWKYYNREEFEKNSIKHWKIFTKGHDVPSENVFQNFAKAVKSVEGTGSLIGVHCTHGVNRTGYLICRYMIEEMNMEPDQAISLFNEARGHNLERENYLQDLKRRIKGKSTYDPDYVDTECTGYTPLKQNSKERWRKNRDDHPNWRRPEQGMSYSHYRPAQYWRTNDTDKFREEPAYNDYERGEPVHNSYERGEQRYYDSSSHPRSQRWDSINPYYRDIEQNMSRKWTSDRAYRSGHSYHNEELRWKRHEERYTHSSCHEEDSDKHRAYKSKYHYSESRELRPNTSREKTEGKLMRKPSYDTVAQPQRQYSDVSEHRRTKQKRKLKDEILDNVNNKNHRHDFSDTGENKNLKADLHYLEGKVTIIGVSDLDYHDLDCGHSKTKLEEEIVVASDHNHQISDCKSSNNTILEGEIICGSDSSKTKLKGEVLGGSDHDHQVSDSKISINTLEGEEYGSDHNHTVSDSKCSNNTTLEGEVICGSD